MMYLIENGVIENAELESDIRFALNNYPDAQTRKQVT